MEEKLFHSFFLWPIFRWTPEIIMLKHTWVYPLVTLLATGLPFQHLFHHLVSALISFQQKTRQVISLARQLCFRGLKAIIVGVWANVCTFFLTTTGASVTMSSISRPEGGLDNLVEIGQGNLKLHYSAQEGKVIHYSNSRNLVLYAFNIFFFTIFLCCMVKSWLTKQALRGISIVYQIVYFAFPVERVLIPFASI